LKERVRSHVGDIVLIAIGIGIAIALRISLLEFKSVDYFSYTRGWYNTLKAEGFEGFAQSFSNYNLPYLYLLYGVVRSLPDLPAVIAVKIPSLVADFIAAWFVFRLVGLKHGTSSFPLIAALATLYAPTLVLNSAFWGQADAVYACMLLGSIFFLARRQDSAAMALYALSLATKAQAAFLLPLLAALVLRREIRWRTLLWIPLVFLVVLFPAWSAGRPLLDLLQIYPSQAGQYEQLSMHAPSALAWIPDSGRYYPYFNISGLILASAMAIAFCFAVYRSSAKLTPSLLLELALISVILVPFFLPRMHERYFYPADMLSVVFAFYVPAYFFVPLVMITISFFAYQPTLFGVEPISMGLLAFGMFVLLVALVRHALSRLFPKAAAT
jgi:Gpi18-like mannosyltransferase